MRGVISIISIIYQSLKHCEPQRIGMTLKKDCYGFDNLAVFKSCLVMPNLLKGNESMCMY